MKRRVPGKTRTALETRTFAQGVKTRLPVLTVTGAKPGPLAVILAGQHGRELNGIAAIERAFGTLRAADVSGTVVFLPVMNPLGIRTHAQDFPSESPRYRPTGITLCMNMNRTWPGGTACGDATYAAQVTEAVWQTYMRHADIGIDLHGWSGQSLCLAWAQRKHEDVLRAFGLPWCMRVDSGKTGGGMTDDAARARGIPWISCELVPQNTLRRESVGFGARGIRNTLITAGMLKGACDLPPVQYVFNERHAETLIRTTAPGLLVSDRVPGEWVRAGETVLRVLSLDTLKTVFAFTAVQDALLFNIGGVAWGEDRLDSAVVYPGQIVGILKRPDAVVEHPSRPPCGAT